MSLVSQDLPSDPDALRALVAVLQAQLAERDWAIAARDAEIHAKTLHIEKLKAQLAVLRRARFGRSSEKLDQAIEQLELLIGELEEGEALTRSRAVPVGPSSERSPKPARAGGRQRLPEHLPGLRRHEAEHAGRGRQRGARIRAVLLQGRAPRPAADELPGLRDHQPGTGAILADRAWPARTGAARACADREVL